MLIMIIHLLAYGCEVPELRSPMLKVATASKILPILEQCHREGSTHLQWIDASPWSFFNLGEHGICNQCLRKGTNIQEQIS